MFCGILISMKGYFEFERDFGGLIKEERKEQNIKQKELAERAGLVQMTLCRYENGKHKLKRDTAETLSDILGYTTAELLLKYGRYDDYIPPFFEGDVVAWESFKATLVEEDDKQSFMAYLNELDYSVRFNKDGVITLKFPDGKKTDATAEEIKAIEKKTAEYIELLFTKLLNTKTIGNPAKRGR